ncbi:MAG: nitrogenase cofactor biosynthesis protein NifB [Thermodesulfobacteriota bacterium]
MNEIKRDSSRHPCFNPQVKGECGRVHLPVAPSCNIRCNYCNRRFDCVNESRPGVTSALLRPEQARSYLAEVLAREPRITVAGIAGPGDPFANPQETMTTLRLVRQDFPALLLCLATNGLGIMPYVDELAELGVSHVTVTVNAVDPAIGARIYGWVREGKVIYRGATGAQLLLARQEEAIRRLSAHGLTIKINTVIIPGINDQHAPAVAARMRELGASLHNCMAMVPNADTPLAEVVPPAPAALEAIREKCGQHLPQMRHCTRCRADAVGLLGDDRQQEFGACLATHSRRVPATADRPHVAVATMEGMLVNEHLGAAGRFQIWTRTADGFQLLEERPAPAPGGGEGRWQALARTLGDCRAVLVSGIGDTPERILRAAGIEPVTMAGFIASGLAAVYGGGSVSHLRVRRASGAGSGCSGKGGGCL